MYNKVFLIGNLTRDPEMRYTTSGIPVTRFTIAVNRWSGKSENEQADFLRVQTWRKLAEICSEYLSKGKTVAVEGSLRIDSFEKDGKQRFSAEIQADNVQILSKKGTVSDVTNDSDGESQEAPF